MPAHPHSGHRQARTSVVQPVESVGISPKVKLPAAVLTVLGLILLVVGLAIDDPELRAVGISLLGGGPLAGLLGHAAKPGRVKVR